MENTFYSRFIGNTRCLEMQYVRLSVLASLAICFIATIFSMIFSSYEDNVVMKYYHINFILLNTALLLLVIFSHIRTVYWNRQPIQVPITLIVTLQLLIGCMGVYALFANPSFSTLLGPSVITLFDILIYCGLSIFSIVAGLHHQANPLQGTHRQYALAATGELDDEDTDVELELDMYLQSDQPFGASQTQHQPYHNTTKPGSTSGARAGVGAGVHLDDLQSRDIDTHYDSQQQQQPPQQQQPYQKQPSHPMHTHNPSLYHNDITGQSLHDQIGDGLDDFDLSDEYTDTY